MSTQWNCFTDSLFTRWTVFIASSPTWMQIIHTKFWAGTQALLVFWSFKAKHQLLMSTQWNCFTDSLLTRWTFFIAKSLTWMLTISTKFRTTLLAFVLFVIRINYVAVTSASMTTIKTT